MIHGIGNNDLYNVYNRIQFPKANEEALQNVKSEEAKSEVNVAVSEPPKMDLKLDSIKPRANASLEDVSLSLAKKPSFEMKPITSDIESLDIDKAVSDMQKDGALMQYQYFVGNNEPIFASEDGIVIAKTPGA